MKTVVITTDWKGGATFVARCGGLFRQSSKGERPAVEWIALAAAGIEPKGAYFAGAGITLESIGIGQWKASWDENTFAKIPEVTCDQVKEVFKAIGLSTRRARQNGFGR